MVRPDDRNPRVIKARMESARAAVEVAEIKKDVRKQGYIYQFSIYGALKNTETGETDYRRIEVMCNQQPNNRIIELTYRFVCILPPLTKYSVWLYNAEDDSIANAGGW